MREPLLHFLLIGAALFLLYGLQNDDTVNDSNHIVISETDIDRLITLWEKKWQRLPTKTELEGLIQSQIREEVLYREALAMGLDQGDTIVRRRLAQKVEFISADIATQVDPSEADLQSFLKAHPDKFGVPARISFQQIYFNADKRGENAQQDAKQLLDTLTQPGSAIDITAAGDSFMFGQKHENLTRHGVSRLFGKKFTDELFKLQADSWNGPVISGYGLHLIWVDVKSEAEPSALDDVRERVRNEWMAEQRKKMDAAFYAELRKRYEITVEQTSK
jgi:hypothetical protein